MKKLVVTKGKGSKIPLHLPEPLDGLIRQQAAKQGGRTLTSIIHEILLQHYEKHGGLK